VPQKGVSPSLPKGPLSVAAVALSGEESMRNNEGMELREPVVPYNVFFEAENQDIEAKTRYF
jgi:hypothetical protein